VTIHFKGASRGLCPWGGVYPAASFDTFEVCCIVFVVSSNTQDDSGRDPKAKIYSAPGASDGATQLFFTPTAVNNNHDAFMNFKNFMNMESS